LEAQSGGKEITMHLEIKFGWFAKENIKRTHELDEAIVEALEPFGFYSVGARFDKGGSFEAGKKRIYGERILEFKTDEMVIRSVKQKEKRKG